MPDYEHRGVNGMKGEWVSLETAREDSEGGEAWWELAELKGQSVAAIQHDPTGPSDRPIFRWENGDMYLGPWKPANKRHKWPLEEGFGVAYFNYPDEHQGRVDICKNIKHGYLNGPGKSFWLASAPAWKANKLRGSAVRTTVNRSYVPRPYMYEGLFVQDRKTDKKAKVTLKDGTIGIGPWKDDKPVGSWLREHKISSKTKQTTSAKTASAKKQPPEQQQQQQSASSSSSSKQRLVNDDQLEARGDNGMLGKWISLEVAQQESVGKEAWWEIADLDGRRVPVRQHDTTTKTAPSDKPVFWWENGDMYLGSWALSKNPNKQWPVEEGFGVFYFNFPTEVRGVRTKRYQRFLGTPPPLACLTRTHSFPSVHRALIYAMESSKDF